MTMKLTLYKGSKVDGRTRMGLWQSKPAQIQYFENLEKYEKEVPTVPLGQPLRVNLSINEINDYNYGSLDYFNDGYPFFFYITELRMVSETMTEILYTVDAWETLYSKITLGRATIHRYPIKTGKVLNPYSQTYRIYQSKIANSNENLATLFYIRRDDTNNADITYFGQICSRDHIDWLFDGTWFDNCNVPGTVSQIVVTGVFNGCSTFFEGLPTAQFDHAYEYTDPETFFLQVNNQNNGFYGNYSNDGITIDVIKDARGLDVFVPEEGTTYSVGLYSYIGFSASSIKLIIPITSESGEEKYITFPLEPVMIFSDQWQEYNYRQRQIDIDNRNINMNKDLANGLVQSVGSMAMGAMLAPVTGGMSAVAGAGLGGAGGIVSALGSYAVNAVASPFEQEIIDRTYKNANDSLTMIGDLSLNEFNRHRSGVWVFKTDVSDMYANEVASVGYPTEITIENFGAMLRLGSIRADVEILNICSDDWREQIANRFKNGVMLV